MPVEAASDREIVEALTKLVTDDIQAGTYVILEADAERNYYIQFAIQGGRLFCEAVSNDYLAAEDELAADELRVLENLGWREPDYEGQNWFRTFRPAHPHEYDEIVRLARRAFAEVYGMPEAAPLTMSRSWEGQVLTRDSDITFASESHRSTFERVAAYVEEMYPDGVQFEPRRPLLFAQYGSAITSIAVNPVGVHSTTIDLYSLVVREVETTDALMRWMLEHNHGFHSGALALDSDGDVVLKHSVFGDTATFQELQVVLPSFMQLADDVDDMITSRFGGYTARDWTHR